MSCQITVEEGTLQGKECTTFFGRKYYSFEGIPYAQPPVGKLRFRNPQPPKPWEGILDCTKPGNKCIQANPYSSTPIDGSEDCLFLNIYTPVLPSEKIQKLPVLFFIHGGRLIFGHGNYYSPDFLLKNDVILVTLNYRLHILGWLCLNIKECTGNMGLKDTALALKWVNKNILKFNGDPSNVTLTGESAGAAMATSFLVTKMADGLFSKVIACSGNCISDLYMVDEDPIEKAILVASYMGKDLKDPIELYNFFSQAPIEDLILAFTTAEISRPSWIINAFFLPVVEKKFDGIDQFFYEHPRELFRLNKFTKVPMILALNSYEVALFFQEKGNIKFVKNYDGLIPRYVPIDKSDATNIQKKVIDFYLNGKPMNNDSKIEYLTMMSDAYFARDITLFAEIISKFWDKVYLLKFNYFGNMHTRVMGSLKIKGATHGDIVQYQFYRKNKWDNRTENDEKIVDFFSESFCNFAKNGVPTWREQNTKWLPYTNKEKRTLLVDDKITLEKDLDRERLLFWIRIMSQHSKI